MARLLFILPLVAFIAFATPDVLRGPDIASTPELSPASPAPLQASCGDQRCSPPEDCNTCPQDCGRCCGDRRCAPPEDCNSCPADCGPC